MDPKTILITGATDGIGRAAAVALAKQGHTVVITGRTAEKAMRVVDAVQRESDNPNVGCLAADFASLGAVRSLAEAFLQNYARLDVLINNAGLVTRTRQLSQDGYELQLSVNHLAPFLLTHLLLPALKASPAARVVNVSSIGHASGQIQFDDLHFERGFTTRQAYYQTKLANVLFTYALARRLEGSSVVANVLHPGIVKTTLSNNYMGNPVFRFFEGLIAATPEQGAQTTVYLATSPDVAGVTGKYFVRKQAKLSAPHTYDTQLQERLWDVSESLVGLNTHNVRS